MENNTIIDFDIKIQLIETAITELERMCASDILNAFKSQPEGDFEFSEIIDIYTAPLKRLRLQLHDLRIMRERAENENINSIELFKSLIKR
mgnify:CR=1 FL=1